MKNIGEMMIKWDLKLDIFLLRHLDDSVFESDETRNCVIVDCDIGWRIVIILTLNGFKRGVELTTF